MSTAAHRRRLVRKCWHREVRRVAHFRGPVSPSTPTQEPTVPHSLPFDVDAVLPEIAFPFLADQGRALAAVMRHARRADITCAVPVAPWEDRDATDRGATLLEVDEHFVRAMCSDRDWPAWVTGFEDTPVIRHLRPGTDLDFRAYGVINDVRVCVTVIHERTTR